MSCSLASAVRRRFNQWVRAALAGLPRDLRHAVYRQMVDCDPTPDPRLQLKIAETSEELRACFALLHDAYVGEGFMKPSPNGLRVTPYHALPTTTTLCAKWDGEVVGTISLVREGVFGFPLQEAFDLTEVRSRPGQLAEVSALAVHRRFRKTGGTILFPLMKFMYEYGGGIFDTRHLLIAVNPNRIELYESLLLFERLQAAEVRAYDFANGAPAVGASLDLEHAPSRFRAIYGGKPARKNLFRYFVDLRMPNIHMPERRYHVTTDPVMTPELLDEFFNQRTMVFSELPERRRMLLREVYAEDKFSGVLPEVEPASGRSSGAGGATLRRHLRYPLKCPARICDSSSGTRDELPAVVIDISLKGFQARAQRELQIGSHWNVIVELGAGVSSRVQAVVRRWVKSNGGSFYGFEIDQPDDAWTVCVEALQRSTTGADLSLGRAAA
jgi:hypothetical protein